MEIKSDNLNPEDKRKAVIGIILLSILIIVFVFYQMYTSKEKKELLSNNTQETICEVIETSTFKGRSNTVKYEVSGRSYHFESSYGQIFNVGEHFKIKYSNLYPNIAEVLYTNPVITENNNFDEIEGEIISFYENSTVKRITFFYEYNGNKYERAMDVKSFFNYKKNNIYSVLVNKKNPKISYLKRTVEIYN